MRRLLALTTFACLFSVPLQAMAQDRAPVVTAPATAAVHENTLLTILVSATDPDGDAINSFTASGTVMTAGATFAANGTNTSGTLSWTPSFTQSGSFSAIFTATNALSGSASTSIVIAGQDRVPVVSAPATAFVNEGSLLTINVTAADPDGQAIASLTASGSAITAGATFLAGAGNVSGTLSWTPTFTQAGMYSVTFTASNVLSGSASTSITVAGDSPPRVTAPATRIACENALLTFTVGAADPDGDAITSLTASGTAITAGATFAVGPGNTSGTLNWIPSFTAAGAYGATFTAQNALSGSASTSILVGSGGCDRAPVVTAPATASVNEGSLLTINVTATDPDGQAVTSLTASGTAITAGATFSAGPMNTSGTLSWTPTFTQAGTYSVTFAASNALTGFATTSIAVNEKCSPISAPSSVEGPVGSPIFFVGTLGPDSEPLTSLTASGTAMTAGATFTTNASLTAGTFNWTPSFTQAGTYTVTLTACSSCGCRSVTIVITVTAPFAARAFTSNSNRTIRLASGKAFWCASVEPIDGSFNVANIVPTSVVLISPGTGSVGQISAYLGKFVTVGDADKNDVEDMTFCFQKEDLRLLFSNVNGRATLDVMLAGDLTSGGEFNATLSIDVIGSGGGLAASVAPNPLNPSGVLSFVSTRPGAASVRIVDHAGRLVRTLDQGLLPVGRHDIRIDGRDDGGRPLATGIYFYRVKMEEGTVTGRFAILK